MIKRITAIVATLSALFVHAQPTADFTVDITQGCSPILVSFTDNSSGAISWEWDFGNGTSNLQNPGIFFSQPGDYTISLIVTDASGLADTLVRTAYIEVYDYPTAQFSADLTSACTFTPITFSDLSTAGSGQINSWLWDLGDGTTSTDANPVHSYNSPGVYPVSLVVKNEYGCEDNIVLGNYITIIAPDPDFEGAPLLACGPPLHTQFNILGDSLGQHIWQFGDGNTSGQLEPSHTYQGYGSFTVSHIVIDAQGCRDTLIRDDYVAIGVNTLGASASDSTICVNDTIFFQTTASTNSTVAWDFGDGDSASSLTPFHVYTQPGVYQASVSISDQSGCTNTLFIPIEVFAYPVIQFGVLDTTVACDVPFSVDIDNQTTGAISYLWNFGDGTLSTLINPSHTYTLADSFGISVIATGPNGCATASNNPNYIQISPVRAGFTTTARMGCAPLTVSFTDTSSSRFPIDTWLWDFGDGNISTLPNPTHTFLDTGLYDIQLIITNTEGCTDTIFYTSHVAVGDPPTLDFAVDTNIACALSPINFINLSQDADNFIWYFGDGDTAMSINPSHGFAALGDVDVMLVGAHRGCRDTLLIPGMVHILEPLPMIGISQRKICNPPEEVSFQNLSIGADIWSWTLDDSITSTDMDFTTSISEPGFHFIELTVENFTTGCVVTTYDSVIVRAIRADMARSVDQGCYPLRVEFTDQSENAVWWQWNFGNGDSTNARNPVYTYQDTGSFPLQLVVENNLKCRDTMVFNTIRSEGVFVDFAVQDTAGCVPIELQFFDASVSTNTINSWNWDFGDTTFSSLQNPFHTYTYQQDYSVQLTVTDAAGCTDSLLQENLVFATQPIPDFAVNPPANCPDYQSVFVSLAAGAGLSYTWDFGDGDSSFLANTTHAYADTGFYDVTLTVVDVNGCDSSITKPNFVNIRELTAFFIADTTFAACPPLTVNFLPDNSFPHPGVQWFWDFGNGATSTQVFPTHVFTQPGSYTVTLALTTPTGCTDTMRATDLIVIEGPTADFTFTPEQGCPGTDIFFQAASTDSVRYEWIFGDGNTGLGIQTTHQYATGGLYQPILVIEDSLGCRVFTQTPDTIEIFPAPEVAFTANNAQLCDSGIITFIDQTISQSSILSWQWDFGDGQTDTVQYPQHQYSQVGSYTVSLTVMTVDSCSETISLPNFIEVFPSPPVVLGLSVPNGCLPLGVQLQGSAPGHPYQIDSWLWDMGTNGITANSQSAGFTYTQAGTYIISLTATDLNGCATQATDTVIVYPQPRVNFVASDSMGCAPLEINFFDLTPDSIIAWQWDFGDGQASLDASPVHTYLEDGLYDVSLTVWDTLGCTNSLAKPDYIRLDHPEAAFAAEDQTICPGTEAVFSDLSQTDTSLQSWFWTFGDGTSSQAAQPTHTYDSTGLYSVGLIIEDVFGCRDSLTEPAFIEVLLDQIPKVLQMEAVSVVNDYAVEIRYAPYPNVNQDFGAYRIYRADPDGVFHQIAEIDDLGQNRFVDGNAAPRNQSTCYKVQVVNHCGTTYPLEEAQPHCTIDLQSEAGTEAVQLSWTPYRGWPFVESYRLYRVSDYQAGGELIASLSGTDTSFLDLDMYCYDSYSYRIEAIGSTRAQSWSDTTDAQPVHLPPTDSSHIVRVTVEDNRFVLVEWQAAWPDHAADVVVEKNAGFGFQEVFRTPVNQPDTKYQDEATDVQSRPYSYRVFTIDSCGDYTPQGRLGRSIHLETLRNNGTVSLQWTPYEGWEQGVETYQIERYSEQESRFVELDLIPGSATNYTDEEAETGQAINCYRITAFEMGGTATFSSSNEGCISLPPQMFSANAFSPNGDGNNDLFEVKGSFLAGFELEIFNRWGKRVFYTQTPGAGWNGKGKDGSPAPEGVYVFIARGLGYEGERVQRVGSITLVR